VTSILSALIGFGVSVAPMEELDPTESSRSSAVLIGVSAGLSALLRLAVILLFLVFVRNRKSLCDTEESYDTEELPTVPFDLSGLVESVREDEFDNMLSFQPFGSSHRRPRRTRSRFPITMLNDLPYSIIEGTNRFLCGHDCDQ
jgi:hypothetical protein